MPARKKSVTQANRSTQWFREHGYLVENVEQTIRYPDKTRPGRMMVYKRDLFNAWDLLAVRADGEQHGITLCQATVGMNNKMERQQKIADSQATIPLLRSGNSLELHIWRKMGKRGCRKLWAVARYQARIFGTGISWIEMEDETSVEDSFSLTAV